ncbi:hypothetical protein TRAPUB_2357 [Trametes pubescens]|uniref:Uncharacterized protein n=1 Tax=Trametes pubescens TaxID=154538 RepID=A0A1M2VGS2_TRAPU|nr:hypothetical protein TRAPUB_2357 [Trametes pubescens]
MMVWTDCPSASSRGHHAFRWPRPEEAAAIKLLNGTPKPPQVVLINRSDRDAE